MRLKFLFQIRLEFKIFSSLLKFYVKKEAFGENLLKMAPSAKFKFARSLDFTGNFSFNLSVKFDISAPRIICTKEG